MDCDKVDKHNGKYVDNVEQTIFLKSCVVKGTAQKVIAEDQHFTSNPLHQTEPLYT
jgi:hypothetical protein